MANEILKLKEIGIHEISRKTRIPSEYVEYILDGNFSELSKLNTKAYIKIISREFDVDLSDFLANFESFCAENVTSENKIQINPKLTGYTVKDNHNYFFWIMFLLILCGAGIWGFKMIKDFDFSSLKPDLSKYYDNNKSENLPSDTNEIKIVSLNEQNTTTEPEITENLNLENEQNSTSDSISDMPKEDNSTKEIVEEQVLNNNVAKFYPKKSVWIGIKNLNDMSKRSFQAKDPFEVSTNENFLIITGDGMIDVLVGENNRSYSNKSVLRFHAYDGKIEKINYDEYIKLNKGKTW